MSYIGENEHFSFRDGCCEQLPNAAVGTAEAARLGRIAASMSDRFCVGGDSFSNDHMMYALCSAISESGKDVYLCENTDLPSFRFGIPLLSADMGMYVHSGKSLKISFFGRNGFPLNDDVLRRILEGKPAGSAEKCGNIRSSTSFRTIYVNNIVENLPKKALPISAGISCGNRSVRRLWLEFFTGEDDELSFQITDCGQCVNAFTIHHGMVSHEKLILAYSSLLTRIGQAVWLPDSIHYAAGDAITGGKNGKIVHFSSDKHIPDEAVKQRFLADPLYMCVRLASERDRFFSVLDELSDLSVVRRDIAVSVSDDIPCGKIISENGGRIMIKRSGKSLITLTAQACMAETASEICDIWEDKLKKLSRQ